MLALSNQINRYANRSAHHFFKITHYPELNCLINIEGLTQAAHSTSVLLKPENQVAMLSKITS
ncbi:hypothetical protein XAP6164_370006 [Xanthomonas phaseoli pv. phaseoli]|nr:hypothetical protein XAP6164_370006 [Xanthomonas phaseoli pv. phaseoli]